MVGSTINPALQVSLFFVKERLAVGDEVLQVSQLRAVNRREVRFSNDAPENCEPDSAPTGIGGSNTVFISLCPAGVETRVTEGARSLFLLLHRHSRHESTSAISPFTIVSTVHPTVLFLNPGKSGKKT